MFRPLALLLSWRYLRTKDVALLFVTKTSMLGLIISITVLLVVQGVLAGFQQEFNRNVLGFVPHITLANPTGIAEDLGDRLSSRVSSVEATTTVVQNSGLVSTSNTVLRAQFIGVDPESIGTYFKEGIRLNQPEWSRLTSGGFGLLLGVGLAEQLDVEVGDDVLVTTAHASISPLGMLPRQKRFEVVGFATSYTSLDSMIAYIHRDDARRLLQVTAEANTVFLRVSDPIDLSRTFFQAYAVANDNDMLAATWQDVFGAVFQFLQRFKKLLFLLISMLVAVATFNLVSSMVMLVQSRRADVAVLRTLGGDRFLVVVSFLATAWFIALLSLVLCLVLAWLIGLVLPYAHEIVSEFLGASLEDGFALHRLAVVLAPADVWQVIWLTLTMVSLGALYPAWRATQLNPSEVLRDE